MHHLATDHWSKKPETRIDWCRHVCHQYFFEVRFALLFMPYGSCILTAWQWSGGGVMLSVMSVCSQWVGDPMWPLPMVHWTSLYRTPSGHRISLYRDLPSSNIRWPRLETCSILFTWGHPASNIWWPRLETCSNLFTWGRPQPVGQRAVGILLECFLVLCMSKICANENYQRKECWTCLMQKLFCLTRDDFM